MFPLGIAVSIAFWPTFPDAALAPRWAVIAVGVALMLFIRNQPIDRTIVSWALAILCAAGLTITWTPDWLTGIDEIVRLCVLMSAVFLGAVATDLSRLWLGIVVGVHVSAALALAQLAGFDMIPQAAPPAGLFINRNMLAEIGAVSVVLCFGYRWWPLLPGALTAAMLPGSRAALGAMVVAFLVYLASRFPRMAYVLCSVLVLFTITSININTQSWDERMQIWALAASGLTWFGQGLGSFMTTFPNIEHAHNDLLQLVFEQGALAAPIIIAIAFAMWPRRPLYMGANCKLEPGRKHETERALVVAVLAASILSFPFHMPATAFAAAIALGRLAADRLLLRRDALAWAGEIFDPLARAVAVARHSGHNGLGDRGLPPCVAPARDSRICA